VAGVCSSRCCTERRRGVLNDAMESSSETVGVRELRALREGRVAIVGVETLLDVYLISGTQANVSLKWLDAEMYVL
jgi:hypothetical protein